MITLHFGLDKQNLPAFSEEQHPVLLYQSDRSGDVSSIGSPILDKIKRLGVPIEDTSMDFLTLSLAVVAADTFVPRTDSANGWTRCMKLIVPLVQPQIWATVKNHLQNMLHFLSGDLWELEFVSGGMSTPAPFKSNRFKAIDVIDTNKVCLFSGGLDSAIGAIDLLEKQQPLFLVSHGYKGDKFHQDKIVDQIKSVNLFSHLSMSAYPVLAKKYNGKTDISMRTRSLSFIAFASIGASALRQKFGHSEIELYMPENGFISLNSPLTSRRVGAYSTRTTHPHFIKMVQDIFNSLEIKTEIRNPFSFHTKGEMIEGLRNISILKKIYQNTVSCSHWKRDKIQCGYCLPCIVRRAALYKNNLEHNGYKHDDLGTVYYNEDKRDDLFALIMAIAKKNSLIQNNKSLNAWVINSGLISSNLDSYGKTFERGLSEIEDYLRYQNLL